MTKLCNKNTNQNLLYFFMLYISIKRILQYSSLNQNKCSIKYFILLFFLLKISNLSAQQESVNIVPPSIENYNFTK